MQIQGNKVFRQLRHTRVLQFKVSLYAKMQESENAKTVGAQIEGEK